MATKHKKKRTNTRRISRPKRQIGRSVRSLLIVVAIVIVLAGLGIAGYFIYEGNFYYQTDNAKVDTTIYQLTANASGKLEHVYVVQGDAVKAGQVLARVNEALT